MAYQRSSFGYGANITKQVSNHYGPRDVGGTTGTSNSDGFYRELAFDLNPETLEAGGFVLTVAPVIPKGSLVEAVYLEVEEAFTASADVEIGTEGSEATNGVTVTAANLAAVGTSDISAALSGTWTAGFLAATQVSLSYGGTVTDAGKARVVVRYLKA